MYTQSMKQESIWYDLELLIMKFAIVSLHMFIIHKSDVTYPNHRRAPRMNVYVFARAIYVCLHA